MSEAEAAQLPRGLRNNNPGNLRNDPNHQWLGQTGEDDKGFAVFGTASYGIRALIHTLHTYYYLHNLHTVKAIVERWAPPSENDTAAYIHSVCSKCELPADIDIDWDDVSPGIALAIIEHENGSIPYDAKTINDGIVLADAH